MRRYEILHNYLLQKKQGWIQIQEYHIQRVKYIYFNYNKKQIQL